ncbi:umecyanin-like [Typha angustifolia]|uniref:umecyanin-like n=1 Tax=Typha angustifolia TaxID=59011 RepID=UPI003C2BBE4E
MASFLGTFVGALVGLMLLASGAFGESKVVHHVVGGDQGWDASSNVAAWAMGRVFRVGDSISNEGIIELRSKEELQSCDLSNPIRMYTGGLDKVKLDAEGTRYFASSRLENCRNGLRLHVEVAGHGAGNRKIKVDQVVATGPMPSISFPSNFHSMSF